MTPNLLDSDHDKSEDYIKRRNQLLTIAKRTKWDDEEVKLSSRGRKPKSKPKPIIDFDKPRNKFYK